MAAPNRLVLLLAACLLACASAKIVMIGDSFSDNGHGANPVVMDALSTTRYVYSNHTAYGS